MRKNPEDQVSHSREMKALGGGRGGSIAAIVAFKILPLLQKAKEILQPWNPGEPLFNFNDTSQGLQNAFWSLENDSLLWICTENTSHEKFSKKTSTFL